MTEGICDSRSTNNFPFKNSQNSWFFFLTPLVKSFWPINNHALFPSVLSVTFLCPLKNFFPVPLSETVLLFAVSSPLIIYVCLSNALCLLSMRHTWKWLTWSTANQSAFHPSDPFGKISIRQWSCPPQSPSSRALSLNVNTRSGWGLIQLLYAKSYEIVRGDESSQLVKETFSHYIT